MPYMRRCIRGHLSPETERKCKVCGEYIGSAPPTLISDRDAFERDYKVSSAKDVEPEPASAQSGAGALDNSPDDQSRGRSTATFPENFLYLVVNDHPDKRVRVKSGQVVGRLDAPHDGRVEIPWVDGMGMEYVSRWHCRFECDGQQWFVIPEIDKRSALTASNPTYVNGRLVEAGRRSPVVHDDQIRLSGVVLNIRILPGTYDKH